MEHEIILDLLPLYRDGVCSEASRRAVEAHLETCEVCRRALAEMDAPLPAAEQKAADDAAAVRRISQEWKKGWWKAWIKGAAIAVLMCVVLFSGWYLLTGVYFIPVRVDDIEITELSRMQDGRVVFHMRIKDDKDLRRVAYEYDDDAGELHIVPLRSIWTGGRKTDAGLWDDDYSTELSEHNIWAKKYKEGRETTKIYLGRGQDAILLWEEGMTLPAANAAQEAKWGYEPGSAAYWASRESS